MVSIQLEEYMRKINLYLKNERNKKLYRFFFLHQMNRWINYQVLMNQRWTIKRAKHSKQSKDEKEKNKFELISWYLLNYLLVLKREEKTKKS